MKPYIVPTARLNVAFGKNGDYGSMPCSDEVYRIPDEWLEVNAKRFHFTDQQILDAAVTEFHAPNLPHMCRCYGIYFLIQNEKIIYVGMSSDIPFRLNQHRENGVPYDSFTWFEAPDLYLKDIEAYYIHRIKPPLNGDYPKRMKYRRHAEKFDPEPIKERVPEWITITVPTTV